MVTGIWIILSIVALLFLEYYGNDPLNNRNEEYIYWNRIAIITCLICLISCIIMVVLMCTIKLKLKPQTAEKLDLNFNNYFDFLEYLKDRLILNNFKNHDLIFQNEQCQILIFSRKKFWKLECFMIMRVTELMDEHLNIASEKVSEFLTDYYQKDIITDWVSLIELVCVDKISPTFRKFVNSNIEQGFKQYQLPVGVSFGGKNIYIAKQKDGFAVGQYKKLRKEFLKIMGLK